MLDTVYLKAKVLSTGKYKTTLNEICDQVPALRPQVLWQAALKIVECGTFEAADKILTEEDKGAPLATAVSLITGLPLCMARWYPYEIPGQVKVDIKSEYFAGSLYMNGVDPGDRVVIVDDTISTGGTLLALAEAVERCRATVTEAIALVEKVQNGGVANIRAACKFPVHSIMKIRIEDETVVLV